MKGNIPVVILQNCSVRQSEWRVSTVLAGSFNEIGFDLEMTQDGSPTLRLLNGTPENGETMHHSGGAFSETVYIYGKALDFGFSRFPNPHILSVGLGLGYIETLAAATAIQFKSPNWRLDSYEKVEGLRKIFFDFYTENKQRNVYEDILNRTAKQTGLKASDIRSEIQKALKEGRLLLKSDLLNETSTTTPYHAICYDAFSSKTNPDLWTEGFLNQILSWADPKTCGFSTYACMGNLKRALRQNNFKMEIRDGFFGKRNCTWAFREEEKAST